MPNRSRSTTALPPGDRGSSIILSNQLSRPDTKHLGRSEKRPSILCKLRKYRKYLHELHILLIEGLVVLAAAGIFWWYAKQAFTQGGRSTSMESQGLSK